MHVAAGIIRNGIEDAKRRWSQLECEPDWRSGFLIRQCESAFEKAGDIRIGSGKEIQQVPRRKHEIAS